MQWQNAKNRSIPQSGLADYPRAFTVLTDQVHLDLQSWMTEAYQVLQEVYLLLDMPTESMRALQTKRKLKEAMKNHLYDASLNRYADYVGDVHGLKQAKEVNFDVHTGILNLFPAMLGHLPNDEQVQGSLEILLSDSMVSKFGVRSLSRYDVEYHEGGNQQHGNVWIVANYLAVRGIDRHLTSFNGKSGTRLQVADASDAIKDGIIHAGYGTWLDNGFLTDTFDDTTGEGTVARRKFASNAALILLVVSGT